MVWTTRAALSRLFRHPLCDFYEASGFRIFKQKRKFGIFVSLLLLTSSRADRTKVTVTRKKTKEWTENLRERERKMKTIRTIVWLVLPITSCLALPSSQQEHARGSVRAKQTTPTLPNRITSVVTSTTVPSITSSSSSVASSSMSSVTTAIPTSSSSVTTITTSSSSANPIVSIASTEQIMSRTAATSGSGSTVFLSSTRKVSTKLDEPTSTMASTSGKETRESPGKIRPQIKLTTNYTSASEDGKPQNVTVKNE
ncbi:mucin-1 [Vespula squamosa]|uniref:Mucin-1 n=1 Tax=Vespula squamosa TaxID=30214 RepID=A0ABD2AY73_VESSQ